MANVIKLKRGTSTPTTSDIVDGEVAIDKSAQKLYVNDSGSIKEIGGGASSGVSDGDITTAKLADDAVTDAKLANSINSAIAANTAKTSNATHTGDVTGSTSLTIANDAVTYAKIQNVSATNRILGRDSSGAGVVEEITAANLRTMINVEDGATADQSNSEIKTAYEANDNTNAFTDTLLSKLNGIEASATADQTASDIRGLGFFDTSNDGSGSGLDSDLLDGQEGSYYLNYNNFSNTPSIPSNVSDLTNDSGFITSATNNFVSSASFSGGTLTLSRSGLSNLTISGIGTSTFNGAYSSLSGLPTIPTTTNQLTNNSNFITSSSSISGSSGSCTGNAATATKLATSRTIAGTSFDGSANISISYNNLTNKPTIPTDTNNYVSGASMSGSTLSLTRSGLSTLTVGNILTTSSGTAINSSALSNLVLSTSGNHFGVVAHIQGDGVMEGGLYIDFHTSDGDTGDITGGRITGGSSFSFSNGCIAPSFTPTSDRNLKNSIVDSDLGLDFINKLKPVSFKWNQDEEELKLDAKTHHGLIAQDVEDVITGLGKTLDDICIAVKPEGKTFAGKDLPMAVDYNQLVAVLIKSVQELSAKVETLESKVS